MRSRIALIISLAWIPAVHLLFGISLNPVEHSAHQGRVFPVQKTHLENIVAHRSQKTGKSVPMQAWRWTGFGFLTLYTYGVLPGIFAWPAGLGDMAIGVTAPLVLATLLRRPDFAVTVALAGSGVAWTFT